jgi:hypothetical protein
MAKFLKLTTSCFKVTNESVQTVLKTFQILDKSLLQPLTHPLSLVSDRVHCGLEYLT